MEELKKQDDNKIKHSNLYIHYNLDQSQLILGRYNKEDKKDNILKTKTISNRVPFINYEIENLINLIQNLIIQENEFYKLINNKNNLKEIELCPIIYDEISTEQYLNWWKNNREKIKYAYLNNLIQKNDDNEIIFNFIEYINSTSFANLFIVKENFLLDSDFTNSLLQQIKALKIDVSDNKKQRSVSVLNAIINKRDISKSTKSDYTSILSKISKDNLQQIIDINSFLTDLNSTVLGVNQYKETIQTDVLEIIKKELGSVNKVLVNSKGDINSVDKNTIQQIKDFFSKQENFRNLLSEKYKNQQSNRTTNNIKTFLQLLENDTKRTKDYNNTIKATNIETLSQQVGSHIIDILIKDFLKSDFNKTKAKELPKQEKLKQLFRTYVKRQMDINKNESVWNFLNKKLKTKAEGQGFISEGLFYSMLQIYHNFNNKEVKQLGQIKDDRGQQYFIDTSIKSNNQLWGFQIKQYNATPFNAKFYSVEHQGSFNIFNDIFQQRYLNGASKTLIQWIQIYSLERSNDNVIKLLSEWLMPYLTNMLRITDSSSQFNTAKFTNFYLYNMRLLPISLFFVIFIKEFWDIISKKDYSPFFNFQKFFTALEDKYDYFQTNMDDNKNRFFIDNFESNSIENILKITGLNLYKPKILYTTGVKFFSRVENTITNYIN